MVALALSMTFLAPQFDVTRLGKPKAQFGGAALSELDSPQPEVREQHETQGYATTWTTHCSQSGHWDVGSKSGVYRPRNLSNLLKRFDTPVSHSA